MNNIWQHFDNEVEQLESISYSTQKELNATMNRINERFSIIREQMADVTTNVNDLYESRDTLVKDQNKLAMLPEHRLCEMDCIQSNGRERCFFTHCERGRINDPCEGNDHCKEGLMCEHRLDCHI